MRKLEKKKYIAQLQPVSQNRIEQNRTESQNERQREKERQRDEKKEKIKNTNVQIENCESSVQLDSNELICVFVSNIERVRYIARIVLKAHPKH